MTKLEKAISDGVKELGGDNSCRQLQILFAVRVDDLPPTYAMPSRSFGNGVGAIMVASQAVLKCVPIAPAVARRGGRQPDDDFTNVILRMDRVPFIGHYRDHRLSPYALDGALNINVKADFLAEVLGPLDPHRASCTFLRFDWSLDNADELIVRGKLAKPYPKSFRMAHQPQLI